MWDDPFRCRRLEVSDIRRLISCYLLEKTGSGARCQWWCGGQGGGGGGDGRFGLWFGLAEGLGGFEKVGC